MPSRSLDVRKGIQQSLISMNCTFWQSTKALAKSIIFFLFSHNSRGAKVNFVLQMCLHFFNFSMMHFPAKHFIALNNEEYLKLFQNFVLVAVLLRLLGTRRFCALCLQGPRTRTLNNGFQNIAYCMFYIYMNASIFPSVND